MTADTENMLSEAEMRDFRRLTGFMVPASGELGLPGADDEVIFADIVRSIGRDFDAVRQALAELRRISGGPFISLAETAAEEAAMALLNQRGQMIAALGQAVLQCYYRDWRVYRALGREHRPPFPKGHVVEQGDFSLLDVVRARPRMWRDLDRAEGGGTRDER